MIRNINILLVITSVLALIGVYALKYSVEETASAKLGLQHKIDRQQADLSMLKADWAYLTQPIHIDPILKRHAEVLGLQVIDQKQFGSFAALPMRPVAVPDANALDALFASLDAGVDPLNAGAAPLQDASSILPSERGPTAVAPVVPATRPSRPAHKAQVSQPDPIGALIEEVED
jgi:hypothetical protein